MAPDSDGRSIRFPASFNVADLFEAVADALPQRPAVTAVDGRANYRQLDALADRWARVMHNAGVGPGDRVAVALPNALTHLGVLLAAFKVRAVPVNMNAHYTVEELGHVLADADPAVVVVSPDLRAAMRRAGDRGAPLPMLVADEAQAAAVQITSPLPRRRDRRGDDPYLLYTGGTTGTPKGVEWRQEDLFFSALGGDSRPGPAITGPRDVVELVSRTSSSVLVASPLLHGTAQWAALGALLAGRHVVLSPSESFDAVSLWDLADAERVVQVVVVGDAFARPLAAALDAEPDRWALDALVTVASGGDTLSVDAVESLFRHLPGIVIVDGYGTTETGGQGRRVLTPGSVCDTPSRFVPTVDTGIIGAAGRVLARDCPEIGRIARRGRIPLRYRNDPVRTAEVFAVIDGERWVLTGDLGRYEDDGAMVLVARGERVIHCGGEKVDAGEVETVVRSHPGVRDVMVVGVPDTRFGQVVGALVVAAPGRELGLAELDRHCRPTLARFKVPRRLRVVPELPRTSTGKLDHRRAAQLCR